MENFFDGLTGKIITPLRNHRNNYEKYSNRNNLLVIDLSKVKGIKDKWNKKIIEILIYIIILVNEYYFNYGSLFIKGHFLI